MDSHHNTMGHRNSTSIATPRADIATSQASQHYRQALQHHGASQNHTGITTSRHHKHYSTTEHCSTIWHHTDTTLWAGDNTIEHCSTWHHNRQQKTMEHCNIMCILAHTHCSTKGRHCSTKGRHHSYGITNTTSNERPIENVYCNCVLLQGFCNLVASLSCTGKDKEWV